MCLLLNRKTDWIAHMYVSSDVVLYYNPVRTKSLNRERGYSICKGSAPISLFISGDLGSLRISAVGTAADAAAAGAGRCAGSAGLGPRVGVGPPWDSAVLLGSERLSLDSAGPPWIGAGPPWIGAGLLGPERFSLDRSCSPWTGAVLLGPERFSHPAPSSGSSANRRRWERLDLSSSGAQLLGTKPGSAIRSLGKGARRREAPLPNSVTSCLSADPRKVWPCPWGSGAVETAVPNGAAVPSAALSPRRRRLLWHSFFLRPAHAPPSSPGCSPAPLSCCKEGSRDECLCFISPSHFMVVTAQKGRVRLAACGLYRAADIGVEQAQNTPAKLLFALSMQFCSSQGAWCQLPAPIQDKKMHKALLYSQSVIQHDPKWQLHIAETALSPSWEPNQEDGFLRAINKNY